VIVARTEAIFESKNKLNDNFPYSPDIKYFDLHRKHFLYGRIDRSGDAIMIEETNLAPTNSGRKDINFAATFVCEAFKDFQKHYRYKVSSNFLSKESLYSTDLLIKKAHREGDLEYRYHHYMDKLYSEFTNGYLKIDRRHEKIVDFKSFLSEFLKYVSNNAYYFPLTRTGYILSQHCSPFISGLMIEIAPGRHGAQNSNDVVKYVTDPNFLWIRAESKKYGFMIDMNAPWRLVFNVASGAKQLKPNSGDPGSSLGGKKYLSNQGLTFENIFDFYYRKAHLEDLNKLKETLLRFYTSYYVFNNTYERLEYVKAGPTGDCYAKKVTLARTGRDAPPADIDTNDYNEYFLKFLLRMRLLETRHPDANNKFKIYVKQLINAKRNFGTAAALNYINNLTKHMPVSKFLRKGKYWYGTSPEKYEQRKRELQDFIVSTNTPDSELTGVKGFEG